MANATGVLNSVTPLLRAIVELQDRHIIEAYTLLDEFDHTAKWQDWEFFSRPLIKPMTEPEYRRERT